MALFRDEDFISEDTKVLSNSKTYLYDSDVKRDKIIKNLSGSKWYVNYYNAINTSSDLHTVVDFDVTDINYEYVKIIDLPLLLDSGLSNATVENLEVTGIISSPIEPRNGDFFIAKLIDGRIGLFVLTAMEKNTYNLEKVFQVTFKLFYIFDTENDIRLKKIEENVAEVLVYDRASESMNVYEPYLKYEDYKYVELGEKYLKNLYFKLFDTIVTPETKYTLSVKINDNLAQDINVVNFITTTIDMNFMPYRLNLFELPPRETTSIYDLLLDRNSLKYFNGKYFKMFALNFYKNYQIPNISVSVLKYIITATDKKIEDYETDIKNNKFYNYVNDSEYVFSKEFYKNLLENENNELVLLESEVLKYIREIPNDFNNLIDISDSLLRERDEIIIYYYIPIVSFLIKNFMINRYQGVNNVDR